MPRVCKITGKRTRTGNNVSHSMRHTKRTFKPNIQTKRVLLDGVWQKIKVSTRALRTLTKRQK